MVSKTGIFIARLFSIVLLVSGIYMIYSSYTSIEALGDFWIYFVGSGLLLAVVGTLGLIFKFK